MSEEPGAAWVGKEIVLSPDLKLGDLVRLEEHGDKLVANVVEPWETATSDSKVFRIEEGVTPAQIQIRRVRDR